MSYLFRWGIMLILRQPMFQVNNLNFGKVKVITKSYIGEKYHENIQGLNKMKVNDAEETNLCLLSNVCTSFVCLRKVNRIQMYWLISPIKIFP